MTDAPTGLSRHVTGPRRSPGQVVSGLAVARRRDAGALAVVIAVAAGFRFAALAPGFSADEVYSVEVARRSAGGIVRTLVHADTHPPLWYLLLHVWMKILGSSEVAVRSLPALLGVGTAAVVFLVGRELWGTGTGFVAGLLTALSPFNIEFAAFARMYTLMSFLVAASFYLFVRLRRPARRRDAVLYVVTTALLLYTHVWGAFFVVAQSVALAAVRLAGRGRVEWRLGPVRWLRLQGVLLVLWAPWLALGFRRQIETTIHDNASPLGNLADYTTPSLRDVAHAVYEAAYTHTIALLFAVAAIAALLRYARRRDSRSLLSLARDPRSLVVVSWIVVPLASAIVLSYAVTPIFLDRYTLAVTLAIYLVVAAAVTAAGGLRVAAAIAVAVVGAGLVAAVRFDRSQVDFFRAPARYVGAHARPGDVVLYDMPPIVFDYYANRRDIRGSYIRFHHFDVSFLTILRGRRGAVEPQIRDPYEGDSIAADQRVLRAVARYRRVWLLLGPQIGGQLTARAAEQALRRHFGAARLDAHVGAFHALLFQRRN